MSTFKKILCLNFLFYCSIALGQTLKGEIISLRSTTPASTCSGGKIIYSTADSQVKICQGGTYKAIGVFTTGTITDGQVLIGSTADNVFKKASFVAGSNITLTPGDGSLTIAASGSADAAWNYLSKTTTYTAAANDWIVASSSSFTITLPTAASVSGKSIIIRHNGTHLTQVYTLNTTSSQVINTPEGTFGSGTYSLRTNGEVVWLMSDGTNWNEMAHYADTGWVDSGAVTLTATTSNPTKASGISRDKIWWRRSGNTGCFRLEYRQSNTTSAANGSGDYLFAFPANIVVDTNFHQTYTTVGNAVSYDSILGTGGASHSTDAGTGIVSLYDSTHFRLAVTSAGGGGFAHVGSARFQVTTTNTAWAAYFCATIINWRP